MKGAIWGGMARCGGGGAGWRAPKEILAVAAYVGSK